MWSPNSHFRYALKEGMSGWDVWAIQIALNAAKSNIVEDGVFGKVTKQAVQNVQLALGITQDGVIGPVTQETLCQREAYRVAKGFLPLGLLHGILVGESGGIIPCVSGAYANGSRDYGPFQYNLLNPGEQTMRDAFDPVLSAIKTRHEVKDKHDKFLGQPGAKTEEEAWRLAILDHNWPAAAEQIAAGRGSTWTYGGGLHLSDPAPWVEAIGVPGVKTGQQWCDFYINSKAIYVTTWSV